MYFNDKAVSLEGKKYQLDTQLVKRCIVNKKHYFSYCLRNLITKKRFTHAHSNFSIFCINSKNIHIKKFLHDVFYKLL